MEEQITKDDLRQFGIVLKNEIFELLNSVKAKNDDTNPLWIKGKTVRVLLNISAGTLQNLRIAGKVRCNKILGTYYYNRLDLESLFKM